MRTWEMKIHFFMISLRPFKHIQVSSKFFRRLSSSGDLTLHKRLVLFLHHPHLKGWQRVHHSASSIRERWHRRQSTLFHIRGVRISIRLSREILRGLMDIMVWRIMHIFIALSSTLRNRVISTMMFIWGFWSFWGIWSMWGIWSIWGLGSIYEEFGPYEEFDLGFLFFTSGVMRTFTWRLSRHFLGTQIFFIGEPFLQLVPTYLANTSPFWFLNNL